MSSFSVRKSSSATGFMVQLLDFLAVCLGGWISFQIRFSGIQEIRPNEKLLILVTALFAALLFGKLYRMWPGGSLVSMVGRVTVGWLATWVLLIVLLALTKSAETYSRIWLVTWLAAGTMTLWIARVISFLAMARMRRAGYQHKTVILYGDAHVLETVKQRIENSTWSGFDIVRTVLRGDGTNLKKLDEELKPDEIWIGLSISNQSNLEEVLHSLRHSVANIRLLPDIMMYQILNHGMSITVGIPMVDISVSPMFGGRTVAKALVDYTVAAIALVLLSPVLLVIAIAVKVSSPGPVLFSQKRLGWNDEEIWVYKFRSMYLHQDAPDTVTQAKRADARITKVGGFLRRTSLDELPQFINVLQGKMSVVGPRPHALQHNRDYVKLIPKYALRHKVKPGITGWAQICGYRGETDTLDKMEGRVKHDIYYLEHWSVWLDLKIIALTPFATIQNKNVY
ncbi:undecaprenyl-phosphate glucose phosphotransferase [Rhodoferax aquaticus]|uniref:Undecaprenyl-phosphate glucose phosphotransferase n=1 Tax=Rhodoferax aquaticus TaxID=2527691 RepID=A0A515EPF3_9BURK|nr:undecaprenyl-phosphate glucose phosphotransferase [Rhodoferax aquaticus]QDL54542.1 undecaprenyl-phosphate glucose phosphotransferase [Rhodoferax aquaticus]